MGHAIVGHYLPNTDPIHKISVISRGQALGYTISLPGEDKFLTTRAELLDTMAMTLGGRAAEEIVFGEITTGASNDLEKVTATAKQMVMRFGMSEKLGPRVFGHDHGMPFLGREFSSEPDYSDEIAREIDDEIRRIVESAHVQARDILTDPPRVAETHLRDPAQARDDREATSSRRCSTAAAEEEVFGAEAPPPPRAAAAAGHARACAAARARSRSRGRAWPAAPPSSATRTVRLVCTSAGGPHSTPLVLLVRWGVPLAFVIFGVVTAGALARPPVGRAGSTRRGIGSSSTGGTFTDRDSRALGDRRCAGSSSR